jgi:hypothetical protein
MQLPHFLCHHAIWLLLLHKSEMKKMTTILSPK